MTSDYRQTVSRGQKDDWKSFKVDRTYSRQGESFHPVNCKGIVAYYTATKTTDQTVTVSIAYVFFLGVGPTLYSIKSSVTVTNRSTMRLSIMLPSFVKT